MSTRAVVGLALLAAMGASLLLLDDEQEIELPLTGGVRVTRLAGPNTCLPCHADVVAEWRQSMHAAAFTDPQVRAPDQSDNFRRQECLPCHAPRPIFEHGILEGTRTLARVERRADGVDCLSCHQVAQGVAATRPGLSGACRPVFRAELSSHQQCYACHNQHNTHDEWIVSPAATANEDCQTCHMPRVIRAAPEVGAPRAGRSHRFLGGRDKSMVLDGLRLEHALDRDADILSVTLSNVFAGHNLPTDSRNRALDLVVTLFDSLDVALPPLSDEPRDPGTGRGTARLRFRNPYRSSGRQNTQLPAGETATLSLPLQSAAVRARIELIYKLSPWVEDSEAHWTHTVDVNLRP